MLSSLKSTIWMMAAIGCFGLDVPLALGNTSARNSTVVVDGKEVEIVSVPQNASSAVTVSLDNLLEAKPAEESQPVASIPEESPQINSPAPADGSMQVASVQQPPTPQIATEPSGEKLLNPEPAAESVPETAATTQPGQSNEHELKAKVDDLLKGTESIIENAIHAATPPATTEKKVEQQPQTVVVDEKPSVPQIVTNQDTPAQVAPPRPVAGSRYPWRRNIQTSVFWVGEPPSANVPKSSCNTMSAWDMNWVRNFGGFDDPNRRNGFFPARFRPKQNPFYFALPFNDMRKGRHKPISRKVIPWFEEEYVAPNVSVCKSRWIAVRYRGRTVYGQWEDVGPFEHDHPEYVFGKARPRPNQNKNAGLDISPAMRDYLGMSGLAPADWKFVDDKDVPPGPWKRIVNIRASVMAKLEGRRGAAASR
ncbi:hypothetical protein QPK87_15305 [Kamptonema cortianum]|nr:hypothetical protein [Oscillatoria laete-virens]MDK3157930.1 hypothetical protein [Kamptonema cortianum]MDL5046058.1 hypothetical protein [Oscillatoria amoena NRMC-F 0135]MDL5052765.1 hypothetical protein [Oscillatoria laete-virens NRMC-F 0139]